MGLLLLLAFTPPASASIENVLTGITNIEKLDKVTYNKPDADYKMDYWLRIWNEGVPTDMTPENLNVKESSCLVYLDVNTTNDIRDKRKCIFRAKSSETYFNGNRIESGITIANKQSITLWRDINDINDFDSENFPDGNITFTLKSASDATRNIIGEYYDGSLIVMNKTYEAIKDEVPDNYGDITGKKENYIHFYLVAIQPSSIFVDNSTSSTFYFNVTSEFLNRGGAFSHYYPSSPAFGVAWKLTIEGVPNSTHGGGGGMSMVSRIFFAENVRIEFYSTIPIRIPDRIIEVMPNGRVELWLAMRQPGEYTFNGQIFIENGKIHFEYDELPTYWMDYPLVDWEYVYSIQTQTEINILALQGMWLAILIIPIKKKKYSMN